MISADFAPNESWDDAWISLKMLFQPWRWTAGGEMELLKKSLLSKLKIKNFKLKIWLFLTGRSALYNLLKSLNLPAGAGVLLQGFTCEAVVLPILKLDLKPVFVDIESETYSLDINSLTRQLAKLKNQKIKVIILQHTFGLPPKYREEILALAAQNKWIVIEDLAHGFDPEIFISPNPQLLTANYYLLSFGRSKLLSSVFGGAILASYFQPPTSNKLEYPSNWFIFRCLLYKPLAWLIKSTYDLYLGKILHKLINFTGIIIPEVTKKEKSGEFDSLLNKAYPNALVLLLNHQLQRFDQTQKQRLSIVSYYNRSLPSSYILHLTSHISLIRYPLLIKNRDLILNMLAKKNIFLGKWYDQPIAPKAVALNRVGYTFGSCPEAEKIGKLIVNLPTNISLNEADRIIGEVRKIRE